MNPPSLPPSHSYAPDPQQTRRADEDHLNLLAVFYLVWGLFSILGLLGLWAHYTFFHTIMDIVPMNMERLPGPPGGPSPREVVAFPKETFSAFLNGFYIVAAVILVAGLVLNLAAWRQLKARSGRVFTLVVAGLNCLMFPLGTALGVFTFIVLLRPSVQELYAGRAR